ncbi:MAG: hypothetical protein ABSD46_14255 [Bacteroidota bacterium]
MQKQKNAKNLVAMVCISLYLVGCSSETRDFAQTVNNYHRSNRKVDQLELFMENEKPSKPFQSVGILSTKNLWSEKPEESLRIMREKATELGLDGVYDIHCAPYGTYNEGGCTGKGFVYEK